MYMSDRMRLLGRNWKQNLIGVSEKPPAMPEDIYLNNFTSLITKFLKF